MSSFRKLAFGARLDTKRFHNDALKFQMVKPAAEDAASNLSLQVSTKRSLDESKDLNLKNKRSKSSMSQEEINRLRNIHKIRVKGEDVPHPLMSFQDITNIPDKILKNIVSLEYKTPTPIQMQAIPVMLKNRDIFGIAPTGSGKSAAFLIPIIMNLESPKKEGFRAVVISPTRELASQIYRECIRLSSGTGLKIYMITEKDVNKSSFKEKRACDILITTPNRLIKLLKDEGINLSNVRHLIVDECDNLFSDSFRDQLGFIYSACNSVFIKRGFFSATWSYDVEKFCTLHLPDAITVSIGPKNATTDLVKHELLYVGNEAGKLVAIKDLIRSGVEPPVMVFVETQERAEELFAELFTEGMNCAVIHSGKPQKQREKVIENFRIGNVTLLICTSLLSRGLDFPAVQLVINYDLPMSAAHYIHSVGRTGRAGKPGRAITYFTDDDKMNLRRIAHVLENSGCPVPSYLLKLKKSQRRKDKASFKPPKRKHISFVSKHKTEVEKARQKLKIIKKSAQKASKSKTASTTEKARETTNETLAGNGGNESLEAINVADVDHRLGPSNELSSITSKHRKSKKKIKKKMTLGHQKDAIRKASGSKKKRTKNKSPK